VTTRGGPRTNRPPRSGARVRPRSAEGSTTPTSTPSTRERFLATDRYRAEREWNRYEGTPQRDLFRELRERFLRRHPGEGRWAIDLGAGPGRFAPSLGGPDVRRVALDLSGEMLRFRPSGPVPAPGALLDRVIADALRPPFVAERFGTVALLGNAVGFAGADATRVLESAERLLSPAGTLIAEIAPGPGERSRYLARLPPSAVGRLFEAPPRAIVPRIAREEFVPEPRRHRERGFQRLSAAELLERWRPPRWELRECVAVAPALGPDQDRIARIRPVPKAWAHLLEVEETIGREPDRWPGAAAVLLAVRRVSGSHD